uniref:Si:ch211-103n10.5 n=1 Tax=Labrus bergylta TaxID=56723 RepID=A0A3Q3MLZ1_9LABR
CPHEAEILILKAVAASSDRGGLSLAALKKALKAGGYDVVKNNVRILVAIKCLLTKKSLVQTKGRGASGSFKLNKKPPKPQNCKSHTAVQNWRQTLC